MLVDVFMTASVNVPQSVLDEGTYYTDQSTKISWQNMEILSRQGTFYIVKATLPVAEEISHLQAAGNAQFSMVLRPDADTRILDVSSLGATTNRIIERYGLPVPETYPKGNGPIATAAADPGDHARAVAGPERLGRAGAVRQRRSVTAIRAGVASRRRPAPRPAHAPRPGRRSVVGRAAPIVR